jgi:hypothetical protein
VLLLLLLWHSSMCSAITVRKRSEGGRLLLQLLLV